MFDFVHEKKRVVQIILLLIILPFAFWGVDSYRRSTSGEALATVDGEKITQQDFDNAMRQQQDRMREMMRGALDPAMFDNPEVKHAILDGLVNQRLLMIKAREAGLTVGDEQLAKIIANIEAFQKDGRFDRQQYETVLRGQSMSPLLFEARVRQELAMRELADSYTQNGYAANSAADMLIRLNEQKRVVSTAQVSADAFLRQVKLDEGAVKQYYDKNAQEFRTPERARVEYITFSADSLVAQVAVSDEEIKKYYEEHQGEFGAPEQRHAAHVLIAVAAQASDKDKQAAKAKAEKVLQEIKQAPAKFAELAKKYSDDPGSAANGGDLGFFGRGMMVKPFEDAAFSLKPGEISGLVQSDFGFHIIKLIAVKAAQTPSLAELRSTIVQRLKQQKASDKFAELAEKFSNTVYEQSDSLKSAAELVKVPVQQSGWLDKGQPAGLPWTDKALQAVFSEDVLKNKRNSAAVEIAPNTLLAVRLLEYKPAGTRPLGEVADAIRQKLVRQQASDLAVKQGQALLAQLQRGEKVAVSWKTGQTVTRAQHDGLDPELARQIVKADVGKLPAYVGVESPQGGYLLARVDEVKEAGEIDELRRARYLQQLRQMTGNELFEDFLADAKKDANISMKPFVAEEKK